MLKYEKNGHKHYIPSIDLTDVFNEGREEAEAECAAKHFSGIVVGDGSGTLKVNIPFVPDTIMVHGEDVAAIKEDAAANSANYIFGCAFNTKSTDIIAGVGYYTNKGNYTQNSCTNKVTVDEDGAVLISNIKFGSSSQYEGLFEIGRAHV